MGKLFAEEFADHLGNGFAVIIIACCEHQIE